MLDRRRVSGALLVLAIAIAALLAYWRMGEVARVEGEGAAPAVAGREEDGSASRSPAAPPAGSEVAPWVVRTDRAAITLAGVVLVDGRPEPNVAVSLEPAPPLPDVAVREVRSTADGRFSFDQVAPLRGWYRVVATAPNLAPDFTFVPGEASKDDIVLGVRQCTSFAYGHVTDASGGPLAGARVSLDGVPSSETLTDAEGMYRLCVPRRATSLRIVAEGYGEWVERIDARGSERHDSALMPAGAIEGLVVTDDAQPVPAAIVSVTSDRGLVVAEPVADASGRFAVRRLSPGAYSLRARGGTARYAHPFNVSVFPGETTHVTVPIERRVRVSGTVRIGSAPLAGVSVDLGQMASERWSSATMTAADGSFVLDDVPIGPSNVRVQDYQVNAPALVRVPDEGIDGLEVQVEHLGRLDVAVNDRGAPAQGATVRAASTAGGRTLRTDAQGAASFRGLRPGTYRVTAQHEGAFAIAEAIVVSAGRTATATLELAAGTTIEGLVVDTEGTPIDGATVAFSRTDAAEDMGASAITDQEGAFRGGPLRGPASYRVAVARSGVALPLHGEAPEITVPSSGPPRPARLTLTVEPQRQTLVGTVLDEHDRPASDARVTLYPEERHSTAVATTFTGSEGAFTLREIGRGPFRLEIVATNGAEAERVPLTLPSGPITVRLEAVGSVHGTLEGFRHAPVVIAWRRAGYDWQSLRYGAVRDGQFTFEGMAPGDYYIGASANDQAATQPVTVAPDVVSEVRLVASGTRTVEGRVVDLVSQRGLVGLACQCAPLIADARSPVVVAGEVRSDADGHFELRDVPTSDLYVWCLNTDTARGGVARIPAGAERVTVRGIDVTGKPPLDIGGLGLTLIDDLPFSRTVATVEPAGPAMRSGLQPGDVLMQVGTVAMTDLGNGTTRAYLALLLTGSARVPVTVMRGDSLVELTFSLSAADDS